jgi:hypothetical protein
MYILAQNSKHTSYNKRPLLAFLASVFFYSLVVTGCSDPDRTKDDATPSSLVIISQYPLLDFGPKETPIRLSGSQRTTLFVTVDAPQTINISYLFRLNKSKIIQESDRSYLTISGSDLTEEENTIEVFIDKIEGQLIKSFKIEKLPGVEISALSPQEKFIDVACSSASHILFSTVVDWDRAHDAHLSWSINGKENIKSSLSRETKQADYSLPMSCEDLSSVIVDAKLSDGFSESRVSWAVRFFNPSLGLPAPIKITRVIPEMSEIALSTAPQNFVAIVNSDAGENVKYSWKLDGKLVNHESSLGITIDPMTLASAPHTLTVLAEGYKSTAEHTFLLNVVHKDLSIASYYPDIAQVRIASHGSQLFSIAVSSFEEIIFHEWYLDDALLPNESQASILLNASQLTSGVHRLQAMARDKTHSQTIDFQIVKNSPPEILEKEPTSDLIKMGVDELLSTSLSVSASDADPDDQAKLSYRWTIDERDAEDDQIYVVNSHTIQLRPTALAVGEHIVKVLVSDGLESDERTFRVQINAYSSYCNNLLPGHICTLVGRPGVGDGSFPALDMSDIRMFAGKIIEDNAGGFFIADRAGHLIWYYNKTSETKMRLGTQIKAGQIKVLVGTGFAGAGVNGEASTGFRLNSPIGMVYNNEADILYVADSANHRVVRISSAGVGQTIFGNSSTTNWNSAAGHVEGGVGTSQSCVNPYGLVGETSINPYDDKLFVACSWDQGGGVGPDSIKIINHAGSLVLSQITGSIGVGRISGGYPSGAIGGEDGPVGANGLARSYRPAELVMDKAGNIYFTEIAGCRVRIWNRGDAALSFFGGALLARPGEVTSLFGIKNSCGAGYAQPWTNIQLNAPQGLALIENLAGESSSATNTPEGFFVSSTEARALVFVNNRNAIASFGGSTINPFSASAVMGVNGSFNGDNILGKYAKVARIYGLLITQESLLIADYDNGRVRNLNISENDGMTTTWIGSGQRDRFGLPSDLITSGASSILLYNPQNTKIHNNALYFSDQGNRRIKKMELTTGQIQTFIGRGAGMPLDDQPANNTLMYNPYGLTFSGENLIYVDNEGVVGADRGCLLRAFNGYDSDQTIMGMDISSGMVSSVAGNLSLGCATFDSSSDNGASAIAAALYLPQDIDSDESGVYVSAYNDGCILHISQGGIIKSIAGSCGLTGSAADATLLSATDKMMEVTGLALDPQNAGNLLVTERWGQAIGNVKYVNRSGSIVTIFGIEVPAGHIKTVLSIGGYPRLRDIALFDHVLCLSSADSLATGSHAVSCYDRRDASASPSLTIGKMTGGTFRAGQPMGSEQEGLLASDPAVRLYQPWGIDFDAEGNLYIPEKAGQRIRMVRKWW